MASQQERGVRVFSTALVTTSADTVRASHDTLENLVNSFLDGDGTVDNPRKRMLGDPQLVVNPAGTYLFLTIYFERIN